MKLFNYTMEGDRETVFTGSMEYLLDDDIVFDPSGDIFRKNTEQYSSTNWYALGKKENSYYWIPHDSLYTLKPRIGSEIIKINTLSFTEEEIKLENGQESKYLIIYHCNNPGNLHLKTRTFGIQESSSWILVEGQSHIVDKYSVSKDLREISVYQPDICTNPLANDPYELVYPMENTSDTLSPWKTEEILDGFTVDLTKHIQEQQMIHRRDHERVEQLDKIPDSADTQGPPIPQEADSEETVSDNDDDALSDEECPMTPQAMDKLDGIGNKTLIYPVKENIKLQENVDLQDKYEEYRQDPWNNEWYTESEFKEYYGGTQEWEFQEPKKILMREELKQLAWDFRELSSRQFKCLLRNYQRTF